MCGDSSSKLYISPIDPSAFPLTPERNPAPRLGPMSISAHAHAPTSTNTQERARERVAVCCWSPGAAELPRASEDYRGVGRFFRLFGGGAGPLQLPLCFFVLALSLRTALCAPLSRF